jgi:hypothetical protein
MNAAQWIDTWQQVKDAEALVTGCGGCAGRGWKLKWNAEAELVEVNPPVPCPACGGLGMVRVSMSAGLSRETET